MYSSLFRAAAGDSSVLLTPASIDACIHGRLAAIVHSRIDTNLQHLLRAFHRPTKCTKPTVPIARWNAMSRRCGAN